MRNNNLDVIDALMREFNRPANRLRRFIQRRINAVRLIQNNIIIAWRQHLPK